MSSFLTMEPIEYQELSSEDKSIVKKLFYSCYIHLGGSNINVKLEEIDYIMAFDKTVKKFRNMSERSINQSYAFLELKQNIQTYVLNNRIDVVQRIYRRRGMGVSGSEFDPFYASFMNAMMPASGGMGNLTTMELTYQFQNNIDKMFAREIHYTYRPESNTLTISQIPKNDENVVLKVSILKTLGELLNDHFAHDWIHDYLLAVLKTIIGQKLTIFGGSFAGVQGGIQTNGSELMSQGREEMFKCEDRLINWENQNIPLVTKG